MSVTASYTADFNKIIFGNNVYTGNSFTGGKSLIHFEGAPRIFFSDESFTNNGDNAKETLNTYATGILNSATAEMTIPTALTNQPSYPSATLGQSLITLRRSVQISVNNMNYNGNWQIETDYTGQRSQLIYFDQFFGNIYFGPIQVANHIGINNNYVKTTLGGVVSGISSTSQFYASMLPLFKFTTSTKICSSTLFLSTTSYFSNVNFR